MWIMEVHKLIPMQVKQLFLKVHNIKSQIINESLPAFNKHSNATFFFLLISLPYFSFCSFFIRVFWLSISPLAPLLELLGPKILPLISYILLRDLFHLCSTRYSLFTMFWGVVVTSRSQSVIGSMLVIRWIL